MNTFGLVPAVDGADAMVVTDEAVVRGIGKSHDAAQKAMADRETYVQLVAACRTGAPDACKAAADLAQVEGVSQMADINTQLAELLHQQSVALAAENAERKERARDAVRLREIVVEGFAEGPTQVEVILPGAELATTP